MTPEEIEELTEKLMVAAETGNISGAEAAIAAGADVNAIQFKLMPLHLAALRGFTEFSRFLIEKGAGINVQDGFQYTPLHYATCGHYPETVRLLIQMGADLNIKESQQMTALDIAVSSEFTDIAQILNDANKGIFSAPAAPVVNAAVMVYPPGAPEMAPTAMVYPPAVPPVAHIAVPPAAVPAVDVGKEKEATTAPAPAAATSFWGD